jgi:hypothetical protein
MASRRGFKRCTGLVKASVARLAPTGATAPPTLRVLRRVVRFAPRLASPRPSHVSLPQITVERIPGGYKVLDAEGQSLGYVYGTRPDLLMQICRVVLNGCAHGIQQFLHPNSVLESVHSIETFPVNGDRLIQVIQVIQVVKIYVEQLDA